MKNYLQNKNQLEYSIPFLLSFKKVFLKEPPKHQDKSQRKFQHN